MRILFVNDAPVIKYGLARGFVKKGCKVRIFPMWRINRNQQEIKLLQVLEEFKPDIVLAEGHSGLHQPALFNGIKKMRANLFYWAIEDPVHINWISMSYARHSKVVFTTAEECIEEYAKKGIRAETLLFACNPEFHWTTPPAKKYKHDIVFVGSNYDIRYDAARSIIMPFVERGYDIKVWGNWWQDKRRPVTIPDKYYGGILPYEDLPQVYSSAKIVLGVHCDDSSRTQTSMRTFEVLGCGAFYLTQYTKAHAHLFEYGKHLVWSRSREETLKIADYFLEREEERKTIATNGQRFVYQHHTYVDRAEKVLKVAQEVL